MIDRKTAPQIVDAVNFSLALKPYDKYILRNGVEVYAVNAGSQDVMQIEWVFLAGNSFDEQSGIAAATNYMLKSGTKGKTALELNEAFEFYGAFCNRACYNETSTVVLSSLSRHVPVLLPLIREMLTESVFPQNELDLFKQNTRQRLAVNLRKCEFVATQLIDSYVYGKNHPYGRYTSFEDIDDLGREKVVAFYEQHYLLGKAVIFVSGRLPENIFALLDEHFGNLPWQKPAVIGTNHIVSPATDRKYRIENDPNAVQGAIRIASPFPDRHHPDFRKVSVLNTLFGGFFGSRLMKNIREEKGYTYGIYSYLQNHIQQSALMIATEAGKDVCEATVEEVYKEMKLLREQPVSDEELNLVRNFMMGSILGDLDGPFHIMARWKNIVLNQLPADYFDNAIEAIRNTGKEELQALAQKYLEPSQFYELVVY